MRYRDVHEVSLEPEVLKTAEELLKFAGIIGREPDAPRFDYERVNRLFDGAIDIHVTSAPDPYVARPFDEIELGIEACRVGMGAVVFKQPLSGLTARSVYLAQKVVDGWAKEHGKKSTKLIGGIVLGYAVGGLNPEAVRCTAKIGGKFVWTPVLDGSHHHKIAKLPGGIEVIDKDDRVVPELREIFKIIARYDMVLALAHQSTRERFIMIDDAKEEGVKRIVIIHANESCVRMSIEQMKMAADKGAYIALATLGFREKELLWDKWTEIIKEVGTDRIILSTDSGGPWGPPPVAQYRVLLYRLLQSGIRDADVEKMARFNAEKLIF